MVQSCNSIYSFRPCHRRVLQQCRAHRLSWRRPSGTASVKEWSGAGAELGLEQKGPLWARLWVHNKTTQLQSVNISQTSLYLFFSEKKYRKKVLNIPVRKISLFECFSSVLQAAAGGARVWVGWLEGRAAAGGQPGRSAGCKSWDTHQVTLCTPWGSIKLCGR